MHVCEAVIYDSRWPMFQCKCGELMTLKQTIAHVVKHQWEKKP